MDKQIPAVSIVIPMYNVEKYVGECLDSILAQTFQDFEVIVVDDCSTDNSRAVVESYLPKFEGKLKLIRSEKNSGGHPAIPRNLGIRLTLGEYIMFVDSDDAVTPTALEEIYTTAKKFDADVVSMDKHYVIGIGEKFSTDKDYLESVASFHKQVTVTEPALITGDIAQRIKKFVNRHFSISTVDYFVRREFIFTHKLEYPNLRYAEDNFFDLFLICLSKNLIQVPNCVYVCRRRADSVSRTPSIGLMIRRCADHVFQGISIISEFAEKFTFLKEHPELQYLLFEFSAINEIHNLFPLYERIPLPQLDALIKQELKNIDHKTEIASFFFNRMNIFNINLNQQNELIQQMDANIKQKNETIKNLKAEINRLKQK